MSAAPHAAGAKFFIVVPYLPRITSVLLLWHCWVLSTLSYVGILPI